jgi:prepilin-type N-terminal cleavage/methylation domain-containing protein/prepilin-type processing-associated H-X9-DG protein
MTRSRQSGASPGFTLVELLVVITVIVVLAGIALPAYTGMQERARVVQDLNNLRQIGVATQIYLNDHDSVFFLTTDNWMKILRPDAGTQYVPSWKIFQSPFDNASARSPSEIEAQAPISYGFNVNAHGTSAADPLSPDKITNSSRFILFAPAQLFTKHGSDSPVTVSKDSAGVGGAAAGGTHNNGKRINACMADLHVESLEWKDFNSDAADPGTTYTKSSRWHPDPH